MDGLACRPGTGTSHARDTITSRGTVTIDAETCKGCELCITGVPARVLTMSAHVNRLGYHYPELHAGLHRLRRVPLRLPGLLLRGVPLRHPAPHEPGMTRP